MRTIDIANIDFPMLRTRAEWERGALPAGLAAARDAVEWCEHLVLVYPLWLGDVPALLKAFLEQLLRPGIAFRYRGATPEKLMKGRSARIVVTMGMPAFVYEWFYRAHSVKSLQRNILAFVGFGPIARTVIGAVEWKDGARGARWLARVRTLGRDAR